MEAAQSDRVCLRCISLALVVIAVAIGCRSASTNPVSPGFDFFPLSTGHYVIYNVDERRYSLTAPAVQRTYQVKEVVGAPYADVTGQPAYRLLRYRRLVERQPWQTDSVWSARLVDGEAIRTENGLDFIKLRFPVSDRLRWDGNQRNSLGQDPYEARNSGKPYRVSDKEFSETVTVVAQQDSTLISQDKRLEVYAKQVGLIYKERVQLQYCSSTPACIGTNQIDYGIRQVYRFHSSGRE
ncbi:MAG TPA: hypothetical protein VK404_10865 [Spirosoma sp.]|jgi:hypothetical protein|nr:hypothetical protein [Spirosoma sp.]